VEDKEERHNIIKEALASLEAYSNNLFARKVTKVRTKQSTASPLPPRVRVIHKRLIFFIIFY
jgi:hypothetical protein